MPVPGPLLDELRRVVGDAWLLTAPSALHAYECDGLTGHRQTPGAVVLPTTTEAVAACVRACAAAGVPVVPRGAGTGLSAGALPHPDGVVVGLARMRSILAVDPAGRRAIVQPGVTNLDVTAAVARDGLYYAPDPSSQQVCSVGGNVAENSGGAHCLKYGFTTNHVHAATVVTADGRVARLGAPLGVAETAGYDLLGVVVGSEGTLGIVTEVVLGLTPRPEAVETLVAGFPSAESAGAAVSAIIAAGITPAAIEMMDRLTIEVARAFAKAPYPECGALLLVELDGPADEVASAFADCDAICRAAGATELVVARDDDERARLWKGRKAAFPAMGQISPSYYVQDGVIPRTRLPEVLAGIERLEAEYGLRVGNVFHAGDGNLHPLVLYDHGVPGQAERASELAGRILDLCIEAGGSITGEHGVGRDKVCHMPRMFDGADLTVMERLRRAFDPAFLMNPEKLIPTPRLCGEIPGFYRQHPVEAAGLGERF